MSWLYLDDRILEHPKFIRAVNRGGSDAVHLWLGIRAYCGQNLTDGFVPVDMIDEIRGPKDRRRRAAALDILVHENLIHEANGGFEMHDYLEWSESRDDVIRRRNTWKTKKRGQRGADVRPPGTDGDVHGGHNGDTGGTPRGVHGGVPDPRTRARGIGEGSGDQGESDLLEGRPRGGPGAARAFAHVGAATPAFLAVFDRYPRKDAKQEAASAFQELAASYEGGEAALSAAILSAFDAGMLARAPYAGRNDKRPFLWRVIANRRWEDPSSKPDDQPPEEIRDIRSGPVRAPAAEDPDFRKGEQAL